MRLGTLKRHWDRIGRRDPFWAALTHPDKRHCGWNLDRFFETGSEELAAVLAHARELGVEVARSRALDFGCGAGRVTQALAAEFDRVEGVDISAAMLASARQQNRYADRCTYHLNSAPHLALFEDASFNFVYSNLVFQHMEARYARQYIAELLRVLAPGGLLVFQAPSHRLAKQGSAATARTRVAGRLPASACRARLSTAHAKLTAQAGDVVPIQVTVENQSPHVWPALPAPRVGLQINLANHWRHDCGALLQRDDSRAALPHDLAPGSRADIILYVTVPAYNGRYWLELDLVQENVGWFAERGSEPHRVACSVTGGLPGPAPRPPAQPVARREAEPPFRDRHPRAFRLLRETGLRDL